MNPPSNQDLLRALAEALRASDEHLTGLSREKEAALLELWDLEHAYYSSVLEGSEVDRDDADALALLSDTDHASTS